MRKRLLFSLMAMCMAVSGFALTNGEYVYTHQGRFLITGDNLNANNAFQDMTGWTLISASAEKTMADQFNVNGNGLSEGMNSVQSLDATAGEGMYFKFEPTSASDTYIVSFKMKGVALACTENRIPGDGNKRADNLVKVFGNSDGTLDGENDVLLCNTAEELTEDWQTFNYAIIGDGTTRTYFISFTGMATTIEIADLQIASAMQFADLRQRDAMLEKMNAYKNCYNWPAELLDEYAVNETIAGLEAIGNESGQAELDELLAIAKEVLDEFLDNQMDDYLAGRSDRDNYFDTWRVKWQKVSTIGDWTCLPAGRGFWENASQGAIDLGHFAGNSAWAGGSPDAPMGVYMSKELVPGAYVFYVESSAALREDATSSSWTLNEGWNPAYGVAYVVKMVDGVATDTIISKVCNLDALVYTPFVITANVQEAGTYEIGFKGYCKDAYKDLKNGSVLLLRNASLWSKNTNKYKQRELRYEANVREQITAGRTQLTTAAENLADETKFWGKAALKACADSIETKIAAYEAMDQDAIIATYDKDEYVVSTTDSAGLMQFEVYQNATKWIIAANNEFKAENDTLASLQTAIDAAEKTIAMRLYDAATGKNDLTAAINTAKGVQTQMKATDYSQENAATIVAANATLAEAVETFKTTVPSSAMTTIVDIDFENDAVLNAENNLYSVPGAAGSMEFSVWSTDGTGTQPFEKGYWSNGEQLWKGYIRVGSGTGTVVFDPTENGSMGTNILKVACDFYIQGLSGKSIGFFLKNVVEGETGPEDAEVFGLFHNFYNGTNTNNTCGVDVSKIWAKSGGSYSNASPSDADAETLTANPIERSHIEVIMDYGRKSMYCTINSVNGSTTSDEVVLEAVPTKFILQCNYNNNDRRAWFDNLKIERIKAGATEQFVPDAIQEVKNADSKVVAPTKVIRNGRIVINGKYGVNGMIIK